MIRPACALARMLQPSIVVLEDVDLIAQHRGYADTNPLLFDVLNQMDGVEEDADVSFLLTTNRADLLEPALAARPGRVDLALALDELLADESEMTRALLGGAPSSTDRGTEWLLPGPAQPAPLPPKLDEG